MQEIISLVLVFFGGIFVKLTDAQVDEGLRIFKYGKYFTAIVFGTIFGFLASIDSRFGSVIIGIMASNVLMKKFDDKAFWMALAPFAGIILLQGFSGIELIAVAVFFISSCFDEFMNDRKHSNKATAFLAENRLFSWIFATALSVYLMDFIYLIGIVCFDGGYLLTTKFAKKNAL